MRKLTDAELDAAWEVIEQRRLNHTGMLLEVLRERWPGVVQRECVGFFVPEQSAKPQER
jgi:hypothetical protein